jgi:hypothetical protein
MKSSGMIIILRSSAAAPPRPQPAGSDVDPRLVEQKEFLSFQRLARRVSW